MFACSSGRVLAPPGVIGPADPSCVVSLEQLRSAPTFVRWKFRRRTIVFARLIRRGVARSGTMVMIGWCGGKLPLGPQLWKSSGVIYNVTTELWKDPTAPQPAEPPEPSTPVRSVLPTPDSAASPAVSPPSATRDKSDELADLRRELVRTSGKLRHCLICETRGLWGRRD